MDPPSDEALVHAARRGEPAALSQLLERHAAAVRQVCARAAGPALADDCAQDALMLAMLHLARLREPAAFGAWVRGIALHVCRRARVRVEPYPLPPPEALPPAASGDPAEALAAALSLSELGRTVRSLVDALPTGQRDAVAAYYLSERSYEGAAMALNIPVSALKTRLHKARVALKHRLRLRDSGAPLRIDERTLAVHEASHAVVYFLHGGQVSRIAVQPHAGGYRGVVQLRPIPAPLHLAPARVFLESGMAGEAGVSLAHPSRPQRDTGDRSAAARVAREATGGDDVEAALFVADALERARVRLSDPQTWRLVERVAAALTERRVLDADEFRTLVTA